MYTGRDQLRGSSSGPVYRGIPEYNPQLDRDHNGIACGSPHLAAPPREDGLRWVPHVRPVVGALETRVRGRRARDTVDKRTRAYPGPHDQPERSVGRAAGGCADRTYTRSVRVSAAVTHRGVHRGVWP
ncbi:excalibur calcium-binding domain-containing protein [Nocardia callitridis]|uniref:excalibur calcium-binding domain-containing protein n=1 Tax=Nocardia callitridis TaxID=648753 RepID=UPI003CD0540C